LAYFPNYENTTASNLTMYFGTQDVEGSQGTKKPKDRTTGNQAKMNKLLNDMTPFWHKLPHATVIRILIK